MSELVCQANDQRARQVADAIIADHKQGTDTATPKLLAEVREIMKTVKPDKVDDAIDQLYKNINCDAPNDTLILTDPYKPGHIDLAY
jgi:DNA-directed RNA polymerase delta subunit